MSTFNLRQVKSDVLTPLVQYLLMRKPLKHKIQVKGFTITANETDVNDTALSIFRQKKIHQNKQMKHRGTSPSLDPTTANILLNFMI